MAVNFALPWDYDQYQSESAIIVLNFAGVDIGRKTEKTAIILFFVWKTPIGFGRIDPSVIFVEGLGDYYLFTWGNLPWHGRPHGLDGPVVRLGID